MGFKEDNKDKFLDPFKRVIVDVKTSLNRINVSAEVIGNRIRITVPKDESGNLTGTIVENIALENSTWIFEPICDGIIEDRIDRNLHPKHYMDLSKFDFEKGILPEEALPDLDYPAPPLVTVHKCPLLFWISKIMRPMHEEYKIYSG